MGGEGAASKGEGEGRPSVGKGGWRPRKGESRLVGGGCRCFGSDRTPGVAPRGVLGVDGVADCSKMVRARCTRDDG
jgi:hypothetical protein